MEDSAQNTGASTANAQGVAGAGAQQVNTDVQAATPPVETTASAPVTPAAPIATAEPAVAPAAPVTAEPAVAPAAKPAEPVAEEPVPAWVDPAQQVADAPEPAAVHKPIAAPNQTIDEGHDQALGQINREFEEKAVMEKAQELGLPYVNVGKIPINLDLLRIVKLEESKAGYAIPFFKVGKKLRLAIVDPANEGTRALIKKLETDGYEISQHLASPSGLNDAMKIYSEIKPTVSKEIIDKIEEEKLEAYEKEIAALSDITAKLNTISSEEALNLIDVGSVKTGASDVHYEPEEKTVIVRFRIDGVLHKVFEIEHEKFKNLANQIKYKSKMKLNITNVPQDGRYSFHINERDVDVRVSSLPTQFGETFVCRYLDSQKGFLTFDELGFDEHQKKLLDKITNLSNGMVLVTGPTGSGKTTTLYSMLNVFRKPENKIITLEDPIEYHLDGISQSQINEKREYDFPNGLRAILRQDPDIVMIGEIRDLETAETSAQAALTGHVLLSTLHTNSAIESIPRLVNMGLQSFMIAPSLSAVLAQRLVRKVCNDCKTMEPISKSAQGELQDIMDAVNKLRPEAKLVMPEQLPKANDCEKCSHTGYRGRMVVSEILMIDFEIRELILHGESTVKIIEAARKRGMVTMREDGVMKVLAGHTTLEEVYRVTNVVS